MYWLNIGQIFYYYSCKRELIDNLLNYFVVIGFKCGNKIFCILYIVGFFVNV